MINHYQQTKRTYMYYFFMFLVYFR